MTIAVAIKTGSAVVFAADSKVTTSGIAGIEQDGSPRWVQQTYENATKVVHDRSKTLMAMIAGHANIGRLAAVDIISARTSSIAFGATVADQDQRFDAFVAELVGLKKAYWQQETKVKPEDWPGPTLLLATPAPGNTTAPRVWLVDLAGPDRKIEEILVEPWLRLEGSYSSTFSLLFGYHTGVLAGITEALEIAKEKMGAAIQKLKVPRPIERVNFWAMPTQDAIDLAVFLAQVEIQMERFLPGERPCGGPVDVMALQVAPEPSILVFPGKQLHHPGRQRRLES